MMGDSFCRVLEVDVEGARDVSEERMSWKVVKSGSSSSGRKSDKSLGQSGF